MNATENRADDDDDLEVMEESTNYISSHPVKRPASEISGGISIEVNLSDSKRVKVDE